MRCPSCGASNPGAARFCNQCGAELPDSDRDTTPPGDRRIVTALFADIVDFARLVTHTDAEDVQRQMDRALGAMDAAIARFGGRREKFIGDAVFAVFGYPAAHDDDALRACMCALAIRSALAGDPGPGSAAFEVRLGIATGEVVAAERALEGRPEIAFTGPVVVRASRIQDLAAPGEILLDRATVDTLRDRWPAEPRGTVRLRSHTDEVPVFALRGDGPRAVNHGRPGRLIGRHAELERLRTVLGEVADRGRGTAVIVRGEAGIGKTRLLSELEASARDAGFAWTWTENVSFGMEEPYRFARVFAQAIADEHGTDSGSMSRRLLFQPDVDLPDQRRMAGAIAAMARDAAFSGWEAEARWAPADPAELGATLRLVARRYVDRMIAEFGPRVVVIDDLQWIDRSSTGQLEELIAAARRLPLLVLATARPEPLPAWVDADDLDWISVEGLDAGETAELAAEVAGAALTPGDARILHGRTGGNPLFVSEIVRVLLEDGALEEREGRLALNTSNTTETVPVTLRAVLGARIDALAEQEREALRAASLIGDTFSDETVGELIDGHRVKGAFSRLAEAALVSPLDAGTWRFAHALIREAAYAGMLASRRRELHALVAEVLQRDSRTPPIALARHRIAAGQNELAVVHLVHAADEAQAVGAIDEAVLALREAADLTGDADAGNRLRRRADRISRAGIVGRGADRGS